MVQIHDLDTNYKESPERIKEEAREKCPKRTIDLISQKFGTGYLADYNYGGFKWSRFYFELKLYIDVFKEQSPNVEYEIKLKESFCKKKKTKYIAVRKGEILQIEEVEKIVKGDK